ncbi:MAG: ribonucleoside-diphosphate reductase subunit alpha [Myxococcales bacterium]|nr:ribonucleoside-diphosphate reductase subunit alpha [Myxococcales bacterium]
MRVRKRDGSLELVDVNRIVAAVSACGEGLSKVDPMFVATRTIGGLYDGATTEELDSLSIQTAALQIAEEPEYSLLAARLLARFVREEVHRQGLFSFTDCMVRCQELGLLHDEALAFIQANRQALDEALDARRDLHFHYFGLRTVYDRYLLKHPETRRVVETPQVFFMRVACGLAADVDEAIELYDLFSNFDYLPSSPTLFNSATRHPQLSSCFLVDSPTDQLEGIYDRYKEVARLSKFGGGIGIAYHRVRSAGSLIRGTNGHSNGIIPWLKTLDSSVAAVNQGGRRKGACCVYLEPWHGDIEAFLELRDNTGDEARRTHNLNLANWLPDLFMERMARDDVWSLFDPATVPELCDLYGDAFKTAYENAEASGKAIKRVKARDLFHRMMRTLAQTGNGWMTFKDASNLKCNQTGENGRVVHLSNLCTEIIEVTSDDMTAVCNLGSVNLARHVGEEGVLWEKLGATVRKAVKQLDRVIDRTWYPVDKAERGNLKWRPIGLGLMGWQDVLFSLEIPFDDPRAIELSGRIQEEVYYHALVASVELAKEHGAHETFPETRAAKGQLQFDLWGVTPSQPERFEALKAEIAEHGLRNSLLVAIAPTATIASIMGCYECIEPQVSNLFKRETLSGEFLQVNNFLAKALDKRGLWTPEIREAIKAAEGSIQGIEAIPADLRLLFRTAWELKQKYLVDGAVARGPFIDQSQSLNLFMESPSIDRLSSMYFYAWKQGLKTTYYLRSRPATRIAKSTIATGSQLPQRSEAEAAAALACSLENPESCEWCQ